MSEELNEKLKKYKDQEPKNLDLQELEKLKLLAETIKIETETSELKKPVYKKPSEVLKFLASVIPAIISLSISLKACEETNEVRQDQQSNSQQQIAFNEQLPQELNQSRQENRQIKMAQIRFRGSINRELITEFQAKLNQENILTPPALRDATIPFRTTVVLYSHGNKELAENVVTVANEFFGKKNCNIVLESRQQSNIPSGNVVIQIEGRCKI